MWEGGRGGVGDRRDVQYLPIVNTTHLSNSWDGKIDWIVVKKKIQKSKIGTYSVFFYCFALEMNKYKEKFKYLNCSTNCSSRSSKCQQSVNIH